MPEGWQWAIDSKYPGIPYYFKGTTSTWEKPLAEAPPAPPSATVATQPKLTDAEIGEGLPEGWQWAIDDKYPGIPYYFKGTTSTWEKPLAAASTTDKDSDYLDDFGEEDRDDGREEENSRLRGN